jgi:hypothetical protein
MANERILHKPPASIDEVAGGYVIVCEFCGQLGGPGHDEYTARGVAPHSDLHRRVADDGSVYYVPLQPQDEKS